MISGSLGCKKVLDLRISLLGFSLRVTVGAFEDVGDAVVVSVQGFLLGWGAVVLVTAEIG